MQADAGILDTCLHDRLPDLLSVCLRLVQGGKPANGVCQAMCDMAVYVTAGSGGACST